MRLEMQQRMFLKVCELVEFVREQKFFLVFHLCAWLSNPTTVAGNRQSVGTNLQYCLHRFYRYYRMLTSVQYNTDSIIYVLSMISLPCLHRHIQYTIDMDIGQSISYSCKYTKSQNSFEFVVILTNLKYNRFSYEQISIIKLCATQHTLFFNCKVSKERHYCKLILADAKVAG